MKILRISLVVVLVVVPGRMFNAGAQTVTILYSFDSVSNDGVAPYARLVQGSDGNFYGTTEAGGTSANCSGGCGTVFRITPSGTETALYSFAGYPGGGISPNDGAEPATGLVQGSDGNFYGTTAEGGVIGKGTVFRITPSGSETVLYSFAGTPPNGPLVQGSDGNFYGTAAGAVFRITPSGSYTGLHTFAGYPTDGSAPNGLVQGSDGNFYGTCNGGGKTNFGTVFRISPSGSYTSLYSFVGSTYDGQAPTAGLVQGSDGNFYGTTLFGGANGGGTVFRISPSGSETVLYSFSPSNRASVEPGVLVQGSDGNFYGTSYLDGSFTYCPSTMYIPNGCGFLFRISPGGSETNLYLFGSSATDGQHPGPGLVQGSDGNFYGTTWEGGANGHGTVFKLTVPLSPPPYPINQITSARIAATNIIFTIPSIAGESYQLRYRNSMTSGSWSNVLGASVSNSNGGILALTNSGGASQQQRFYQIAITP